MILYSDHALAEADLLDLMGFVIVVAHHLLTWTSQDSGKMPVEVALRRAGPKS